MPWYNEPWSQGILLGIKPDERSGYRAYIWFEYTRMLINQIREGSLVAVRNFSDRSRNPDGSPAGDRGAAYEEYSILQIDLVHPWHYAIQGSGDTGYPAFNVAAAESARNDWTDMDQENRDDVSRVKCEAIPVRLMFRVEPRNTGLPRTYADRSIPMPGFPVYVLIPDMTKSILNREVSETTSFELGRHLVQYEVPVQIQVPELLRLHFGVFGFTGAGKSNLVSTLVRNAMQASRAGSTRDAARRVYKAVLIDLMDEYTGLLIDQLCALRFANLIISGRNSVPAQLFQACVATAEARQSGTLDNVRSQVREASEDWADRLVLPTELDRNRDLFGASLANLILDGKVRFFEPMETQGLDFRLDLAFLSQLGAQTFGDRNETQRRAGEIETELRPLIEQARESESESRDSVLRQIETILQRALTGVQTDAGRRQFENFRKQVQNFVGARGRIPQQVLITPRQISRQLNFQPQDGRGSYLPSLTIVIGENEELIARFTRELVIDTFKQRRDESILFPTVSFVVDEADVFLSGREGRRQEEDPVSLVQVASQLARRGRKFGLGLGIATQRIIYLDSSIMAQPHTYFVSKLPRKSDRDRIIEAFAISPDTLEQTFAFSPGQWLVTSFDATGLKGTPFPVAVPDANVAVRSWLDARNQDITRGN